MTIDRRRFVATASAAALLATLQPTDLIASSAASGVSPLSQLPEGGLGGGREVVIVGAGISGLVAAYELTRRDFRCTVLEGDTRCGGRSLTIRRGTVVSERGRPDQVCRFDDGLYLNAGPAKLASSHPLMLEYCRRLGIALEAFINFNANALFVSPGHFEGKPVRLRQLDLDLMHHLQAAFRETVRSGMLGPELSSRDVELLIQQFQRFAIARSGRAMGTPGVSGEAGSTAIMALRQLLQSQYWMETAYQQLDQYQQPTLMQPVGGMDRIVAGFEAVLPGIVKKQCAVQQIENRENGVVVSWWDAGAQQQGSLTADFCIASIPAPLFAGIKTNFSASYRRALRAVRFSKGAKLGFQAESRLWEQQQSIYGGISFVDHPIRQFWYPSDGFLSRPGVVVGAYPLNRGAERFARLDYRGRAQLAREGAELLHPGIGKLLQHPISMVWHRQRFSVGVWPKWKRGFADPAFQKLLKAEGRTFLSGDQISELPGWQEGAAMSAHRVVSEIVRASITK